MGTPSRSSAWAFYPPDWPACHWCFEPALSGHLTCGSVLCPEGAAREAVRQRYAAWSCCGDQVQPDHVVTELPAGDQAGDGKGVNNA